MNTTDRELPVEPRSEIQEYNATEAALSELRRKYAKLTFDVTTVEGMKDAKTARNEIRSYRTSLDKLRKEIKAPALRRCEMIDSEARRITDEIRSLEDPIAKQIQDELDRQERELEEAAQKEQERVDPIIDRIADMRNAPLEIAIDTPVSEIERTLAKLEATTVDESFDEFEDEARDAKAAAVARVSTLLSAARQHAKQQEELAELRRKEAEREAREAAEREAREAEERERRLAEQKVLDERRAAQEAEDARLKAEREAVERAQREMEERKAAEEREQAEREEAARIAEIEAAEAAKALQFPGEDAIVGAVAKAFDVPTDLAADWICQAASMLTGDFRSGDLP